MLNFLNKKKRTKAVAWLAIILLAASAGLIYFFNRSSEQSIQIEQQSHRISSLQQDSTNLTHDNEDLTQKLNRANDNLSRANTRINRMQNDSTRLKNKVDSCQSVIRSIEGNVEQERKQAKKATDDFNSFKNNLANNPLIIYDVQIANTYSDGNIETNYDGYIYSSRSMYLTPKIKYIGVNGGNNYTLKVKLYTPNGSLSRGTSSPLDCSYTSSTYVISGKQESKLSGWGGNQKGHWSSGTYKIEIWYYNTCLFTKQFTIY